MLLKNRPILFLAPSMQKGGMERQLSLLLGNLLSENFTVHLALFRTIIEYSVSSNIVIHNLNKKSKYDFLFLARFIVLLLKVKPLIIYSTISGVNNYCQIIGSILGFPVICSIRTAGLRVDYSTMKFINHLFPYKMIICNSYNAKNVLLSYIPKLSDSIFRVIPNGVDINIFRPKEPECLRFNNQDLYATRKYRFLLIGRLIPEKNHIFLMHAFDKSSICDTSVLVFIGNVFDQKYYSQCQHVHSTLASKSNIFWEDAKNNIEDYYNWADCFILASIFEGCPNVLLEAMACELPVLVSEDSDKDHIVTSNVNGYRFLLDSYDQIIHYMSIMYDKKNKKSVFFGKNNRAKIIQHYSEGSMIASNCKIIESVLNV